MKAFRIFAAVIGCAGFAGLAHAQLYTNLHEFSSSTGSSPTGSLTLAGNRIYGMTLYGGAADSGVIFGVDPNGASYTNLHSFADVSGNGAYPVGSLTLGGSNFYGTTYRGGLSPNGSGVIFSIGTNGTGYANLYEFSGSSGDGALPVGTPAVTGSVLYGMTQSGGANSIGVIYTFNTDGSIYSNLYEFAGGPGDGATPCGSLTLTNNTLYGMTVSGGNGVGVIFKINTDGNGYTNLHEFTGNPADGAMPYGSLILSGTKLYGMTANGGAADGVIFRINTNGTGYTNLHEFAGGATDGLNPYGSLLLSGITLFGLTSSGGSSNSGVAFKIITDGTGYTNLHTFAHAPGNGDMPYTDLALAGPVLYGMTTAGGVSNLGVLFSINLGSVPCSYDLNPSTTAISGGPRTNTVAIATALSCPWNAAANDSFITLTSATSGVGSGSLTYAVAANTSGDTRTGTITIATLPVTVIQAYDSVGDGIPDWWRAQYFGSTGTTTNSKSCATCDADGTGQNNRFKFLSGLNPTNPASAFRFQIAAVPGQLTKKNLSYSPYTTGLTYTVQFTTNLAGKNYTNLTSISAPLTNGNQITVTDTNAVQSLKFYHLNITLP